MLVDDVCHHEASHKQRHNQGIYYIRVDCAMREIKNHYLGVRKNSSEKSQERCHSRRLTIDRAYICRRHFGQ